MSKQLKGSCGLNCSECPAFIAFKTDDDDLREKTAVEWSKKYDFEFKKEMINCASCLSKKEPLCGYCKMCTIRNCEKIKKIKYCFDCKDFEKCKTRKDFEKSSTLNIKELKKS